MILLRMMVHVDIRGSRRAERDVELPDGATLLSLLRNIAVRPDGVVCFSAGYPLPIDAVLREGAEVTIIEAASGG